MSAPVDLEVRRDALFAEGSPFAAVEDIDILGLDATLAHAQRIVQILRHHGEFAAAGASIEPGAVFYGRPGTGKTLTARWIASRSGARFVSVRDWPVGARQTSLAAHDISEIFDRARAVASTDGVPVLLVWDEADLQDRGKPSALRGDEVVAQLRTELDGVSGRPEGVYFIATVNTLRNIDPSLLRAGRLRALEFAPDLDLHGPALVERHAASLPGGDTLAFDEVSWYARGAVNAAVPEEAVKNAWTEAMAASLETGEAAALTTSLVIDALLDLRHGVRSVRPADELTGFHEAAHAAVAIALGIGVLYAEVAVRGGSAGRVLSPTAWRTSTSDDVAWIAVGLAPVVAGRMAGLDPFRGVGFDRQMATRRAQILVNDLGLTTEFAHIRPDALEALGGNGGSAVSEALLEAKERDISRLHAHAAELAEGVIAAIGTESLQAVGEELLRVRRMTCPQFIEALARHGAVLPVVAMPSPLGSLELSA